MKKVIIVAFTFFYLSFIICHSSLVYADYVLPYPSFMPGNTLYKVSKFVDAIKRYWYFGNIAQIKYHLGLADKYLVEAKTLFEYNQYLLGVDALKRSDNEFSQINPHIVQGKKEDKDMTHWEKTVIESAKEHREVLQKLKIFLPSTFTWSPEKTTPVILPLHELLDSSIALRTAYVVHFEKK